MKGPSYPSPARVGEVDWVEGAPVSPRFGDVYFSRGGGLDESRTVFLQGCGLPEAWRERDRFTVAELGLGTGRNLAALLDLWRRTREPGSHLSIFSVEAYPLARDEAAKALATWPELADATNALLAGWPKPRSGFHRNDLPGFDATLDIYVGEVEAALGAWSGPADAWFLDGFAPARNPAMWSEAVLAAVGRLSAPGAAAATYTVAGAVRRGLAAAGFEVVKRPGSAGKRERLEARRPIAAPQRRSRRPHRPRVVVVGGGIAGASLVRALRRLGAACVSVEATSPGAGASGNPAALVTPRLDAGLGPVAVLHAQAFLRAVALYRAETPRAVLAEGALQLAGSERDLGRFARIAGWNGFDPGGGALLDTSQTSDALAETAPGQGEDGLRGALRLSQAMVVRPADILSAWLAGVETISGQVATVAPVGGGWACLDATGQVLAAGDAVSLAAGVDSAALADLAALQPVRGQLEYTEAEVFEGMAAAWGAYAIPIGGGGVVFGASHRRGDAHVGFRAEERAANLAHLAARRPALAARMAALPPDALRSRASLRAAARDHLPLAGLAKPGLGVLAGLGGRGFTLAPLLAEHVVARLLEAPSPLPTEVTSRLDPLRFGRRKP